MTDLRIQFVNYRTKKYLIEAMRSVFEDVRDAQIGYEVAVLDNASGDDLSDLTEVFPGKPISVIVSDTNLGFGAGHNRLAKSGDATWLLLLNPDIKCIEPNTITRLLERAKASQAVVVGPRLVTPAGGTQWWDHGELSGIRAWIALNSGNSFWHEQKQPVPTAWVSGAVLLIRKDIFDDLGGFDERFFLYKEEEELCWRIRQRGGTIVYDPTISVFHHGGVVAKKSDHMQQSVSYFLDKHFRHRFGYRLFKLLNKILR